MAKTSGPNENYTELRRWFNATGHAYVSVLRWYHTVGYARHGCTSRDMPAPPGIEGDDIEYLGNGTGRIDGRPMTPEELIEVCKLLEKMDTGAGDGIEGRSTLVVVVDP